MLLAQTKHQSLNENRNDARIDGNVIYGIRRASQNVTPRFEIATVTSGMHFRLNSNRSKPRHVNSYLNSLGKSGLAALLARIREKINPSDSTQTIAITVKLIGYSSLRFMTDIPGRLFPSTSSIASTRLAGPLIWQA